MTSMFKCMDLVVIPCIWPCNDLFYFPYKLFSSLGILLYCAGLYLHLCGYFMQLLHVVGFPYLLRQCPMIATYGIFLTYLSYIYCVTICYRIPQGNSNMIYQLVVKSAKIFFLMDSGHHVMLSWRRHCLLLLKFYSVYISRAFMVKRKHS